VKSRRQKAEGRNAPLHHDGRVSKRFCFLLSAFWFAAACNHQQPIAAPPPLAPPPAPVAAPTPPLSLYDARKLQGAEYEQALTTLSMSADPVTSRRALALLGLFYVDQKRPADAVAALTRAADADPRVAPWLRLRVVDLDRDAAKFGDAIIAARRIVQETPASSAATVARLRLPALYAAVGDTAQTDAAARDAAAIGIDELTEADFVALAKSLATAGRQDLANDIRMRLLTQFPQGRFTEQTYGLLRAATPSPLDALSFDDALKIATQLGSHDRFDQALDMLRRIGERFPNAGTAATYRNVRDRALFRSRHYTEMLAEPRPSDPALQLLRARAAWRLGHSDDFLAALKQIIAADSEGNVANEARVLRAKFYSSDQPDFDRAAADLQQAVDNGFLGNEGENLWALGWAYYLGKHDDEALAAWDRYARAYPDGDYLSNALFWSGKLAEKNHTIEIRNANFRVLEQKYPYSYFSYRARQIEGGPVLAPNDVANGNVFPDIESLIAATTDPRLDSVRELQWLGLHRDATREMKAVAAGYPDNLGLAFMLADAYVRGGEPFKANGVLQKRFRQFVRHGGTNVPQRFWEILFPLNYWDSIKSEAEKRQLDPYLIASIIRQESGFEPSEVSNAGAVGIMQIMPAESASIATAAGVEAPTRDQLFDPKVNIAIGAAEFAQKLARMNGNPTLAIAAYNAGEDAVGKWLAQTPVDDIDMFVESIPYAETRLYVKSVTRNRFEYRRVYEGVKSSLQSPTAARE